MPRKKQFKVYLDEADKLNLEKLSKRHKISQKVIIGYLFELALKYDLFESDWKDRLDAVDQ